MIGLKTVKQVADIFMVSERTVKRWLAKEKMKSIKIGGTVRITDEEIERIKAGVSQCNKDNMKDI